MQLIKDNRGVAALLTIVIVSVAVLLMAFSAAILGMGELDMGWTAQKGREAFAWADGCGEEALRQLQLDNSYSGETLSLGGKTCIISIISNGDERTITISGTVGDYTKKIKIKARVNGRFINLDSWQEI